MTLSERDTVPIERLVNRVDERHVSAQLHQPGRNGGQCMRRRKTAILVERRTRILKRPGPQVDAALRLRLQETEMLCCRIEDHSDDIVAAHRHVAVIFPA